MSMNYLIKYLLIDLALDLLALTVRRNMAVQSPDEDIADTMEWTDDDEDELEAIRSSTAYRDMMEWYRTTTAVDRAKQDYAS